MQSLSLCIVIALAIQLLLAETDPLLRGEDSRWMLNSMSVCLTLQRRIKRIDAIFVVTPQSETTLCHDLKVIVTVSPSLWW
jgi:hypothetical protein